MSSLIDLRRRYLRALHFSMLRRPLPNESLPQLRHASPLRFMHTPRARCVGLYVDATCINYDSNAFDAAPIAMVAALKYSASPQRNSCRTRTFLTVDRESPK